MTTILAEIRYAINNSSSNHILTHLQSCNINFDPPLDTYIEINSYSKKIANSAERFECWYGNELIGLVAIYLNDFRTKKGYITNVSVIKAFFGLGIAGKLIEESVNKAIELGFESIELEVHKANLKAIKLYQKNGFLLLNAKDQTFIMKKNLP